MSRISRMLGCSVIIATILAAPLLAGPVDAQSLCGPRVSVGPGDTLSRIAARCGTTATAILRMNPQITNPNVIHIGQIIHLASGAVTRPVVPRRPTGTSTYVVRPGDTLYRIAFHMGVPLPALLAANPHVDPRFLQPGMTLRLPGGGIIAPPAQPLPPRPPAESIALAGIISDEGVTCPAMRGRDGRLYTLVGDVGGVRPGDRVRVEGRIAAASICMQGTTIDVHRLRTYGGRDADPGQDRFVTVTGRVTDEGVECTAIRGSDGRLYTLAGNVQGLRPGDRVEVIGRRVEASLCMQGMTGWIEDQCQASQLRGIPRWQASTAIECNTLPRRGTGSPDCNSAMAACISQLKLSVQSQAKMHSSIMGIHLAVASAIERASAAGHSSTTNAKSTGAMSSPLIGTMS
jgi:LysM repeat protein